MIPTPVYDSYWRYAAERHSMYVRRLAGEDGPWTSDPILQSYRFTNTFRAADRVSQFLIRDVQRREDRSTAPAEVVFRTLLFKIFNKISTWQTIERELGPISWQSTNLSKVCDLLDYCLKIGIRVYSPAYIMPAPKLGKVRKHANHLALLELMMKNGLPAQVMGSRNLSDIYELLKPYPGLGPFLAFQYAVDLNYSEMLSFPESDFVVAGPGAIDGISKCFENYRDLDSEAIIFDMTLRQGAEFNRLGLKFDGLFGRDLQPIDCQNIFCEISKYSRASHPEIRGQSHRTRIKQKYRPEVDQLADPLFPENWELAPPQAKLVLSAVGDQLSLWN